MQRKYEEMNKSWEKFGSIKWDQRKQKHEAKFWPARQRF